MQLTTPFAGLARPLAVAVLCLVSAAGQACTHGSIVLAITPANPTPWAPLTVTITGPAMSAVALYRSTATGASTVTGGGPFHNASLCLAAPVLPIVAGVIPASGVRTLYLAPVYTGGAGASFTFQAATVAMNPPGPINTSNTVTVTASTPAPPVCAPGTVQLAVTPSSVPVGTFVSVLVTGTPGAAVILYRGPHPGATSLAGSPPLQNSVVCLNPPFAPVPLCCGIIPASGLLTIQLGTSPTAAVASTETFQAFTVLAGSSTATAPVVDSSNTSTITFLAPPPPAPCNPGTTQLVILPDTQLLPGNTVSLSITGTPGGQVVLVDGPSLGSLQIPFTNTMLCLAWPIEFNWIGTIPPTGTLAFSHTVPATAVLPGNITTWYQAVVVTGGYGPGGWQPPTYDVSNTDSLFF